ncbi:hypothetical protein ILYODFUR_017001 [Ilyodon furcidens]|uniref:SRCR domain-containing protein n=1 Tax=Ilyodon furcidens TaxID=33524 RepID=A0ABV0TY23_9TELE
MLHRFLLNNPDIFSSPTVILLSSSSTAAGSLVRLAGSDRFCSGRVEIYHNGVWVTVCDDKWDSYEADVVCRQLGCGPPLKISAFFGEGSGPIWLDDVSSRYEASLSECSHKGFGAHNCEHVEDVGITCRCKKMETYCQILHALELFRFSTMGSGE